MLKGFDYLINDDKTKECTGFGITIEFPGKNGSIPEKLRCHYEKINNQHWIINGIIPHSLEPIELEFNIMRTNPPLDFIRDRGLNELKVNIASYIQLCSNLVLKISDMTAGDKDGEA